MVFLGAGIILLPDMPLITIMFYSQVINGAILPVILIFMLLLINDRRIMGVHERPRDEHHLLADRGDPDRPVADHAGLRVVHQVVTAPPSDAILSCNE